MSSHSRHICTCSLTSYEQSMAWTSNPSKHGAKIAISCHVHGEHGCPECLVLVWSSKGHFTAKPVLAPSNSRRATEKDFAPPFQAVDVGGPYWLGANTTSLQTRGLLLRPSLPQPCLNPGMAPSNYGKQVRIGAKSWSLIFSSISLSLSLERWRKSCPKTPKIPSRCRCSWTCPERLQLP